jgi:type I restriction enzyme, S subunit
MSWKKVKLGDIADTSSGGTPSRASKEYWDGGSIPWIKSGQLKDCIIKEAEEFITEEGLKYSSAKMYKEGTLLLALYGATAGKLAFLGLEAATNQAICSIIPKSDTLHKKYLYYYLLFIRDKIISDSTGGAQPNISQNYVKQLSIPLPPLHIQQHIADVLDKADALRQKDQLLLQKYDELAQSIFYDMFGDPVKNEKGWEVKNLDEVCNKITDGEHGTVKRTDSGRMYLMAKNIRDGFIDFNETDYLTDEDHQKIYKRCNPEEGDLLLVCVGATIGRCSLVPKCDEFSLARSVALIKPNKELIQPLFLYNLFKTPFLQRQIQNSNNSSAQAGLYTGKIKELEVVVPSLVYQNKFGRLMESLENSKIKITKNIESSNNLFNAVLKNSFN